MILLKIVDLEVYEKRIQFQQKERTAKETSKEKEEGKLKKESLGVRLHIFKYQNEW